MTLAALAASAVQAPLGRRLFASLNEKTTGKPGLAERGSARGANTARSSLASGGYAHASPRYGALHEDAVELCLGTDGPLRKFAATTKTHSLRVVTKALTTGAECDAVCGMTNI